MGRDGDRSVRRRAGAVLACALVLVTARDASAQALEAPDSTMRLSVVGDVPAVLLSAAAAGWPLLVEDSMTWRGPGVRDRAGVNAFDRIATRQWSPAIARASDGVLWGSVGGAVATTLVANLAAGRSWQRLVVHTTVVGESVLVALGLTQTVKYSVRRARPAFYNPAAPDEARSGADANLSFLSGHTSLTAAALTSLAVVEWLDDPGSGLAWAATALAAAGIPTVAVLRVAAGRHYPSDVLAGAAVGIATGVVVPLLHRWRPRIGQADVQVGALPLQGGAGAMAAIAW